MFNQVLTLSAALLLWTPSLGAQQSHQDATGPRQEAGMMANCMMQSGGMGEDKMDMMSGDMGMMSSSAPGPAVLIRMGQVLDLTEKQITDLEVIQVELTDQRASHMPLVMAAHQQAADLIVDDETDLAEYEDTLREAMGHMISVHVSVARAALDARAVLTDEQRVRLEGAVAMMRHMESMRDGGMQGMSDEDSDAARHEHGAAPGR
jgi:hypothetical protein